MRDARHDVSGSLETESVLESVPVYSYVGCCVVAAIVDGCSDVGDGVVMVVVAGRLCSQGQHTPAHSITNDFTRINK